MSAYNVLREDKEMNRQYNTMELEGSREFQDDSSKKIYTFHQMACAIGIVIVIFMAVFLLIWFLSPQYHCIVPYNPPSPVNIFPWQKEDLPEFVYPIHYSLFINADQKEFQFQGNVNITFKILEDTDFIVLNAGCLNLTDFKLWTKGNNIERYIHNVSRQQLYLKFDHILKNSGNYTIGLTFAGRLQQNMEGIYITSYIHSQGMERHLVATHLLNKHARDAFPCFDEPRFKSTFQLSLIHSFDYDPISNTALRETTPNGNTVTSLFDKTPNMSTHSLAFLTSDFKSQKREYEGVSVRIITPTQFYAKGSFAIQTCIEVLKYYRSLKFTLSFPKLDISYVPNSGYSGSSALNIIFMKPTDILWDQEGSAEGKYITVSSIAHQIIHQYFGNQVDMKFWNESWFMEGISTYFEHLAAGKILEDETRGFAVDVMRSALSIGSLLHSVPLDVDVRRQSEITNIFDKIAYYKGAALVWMLDAHMESDVLQRNLLDVLEQHKQGCVSFPDIWSIMDQTNTSSMINISTLMKSWIENKGYPLVTIIRHEEYIIVSQEAFVLENNEMENDVLWDIPFTIVTDSSSLEYHILQQRSTSLNMSKDVEWFKANINQTGFYRVNYDEPSWKSLSGLLQHSPQTLNSFDRSNLIDDALTFARAGKLDIGLAFNLLDYLKNEKEYEPWKATLHHFHEIGMLMQDHDELHSVQAYFLSVLSPTLKTIDWIKDGSLSEIKLRSILLAAALENEDTDVINNAVRIFNEWMNDGKSISPNLQEIVLWAGVKYGGSEEWDFCWKNYQNAVDPREKMQFLIALGKTQDIWRLKKYLHSSLNESIVSIEDVPLTIASVANNALGGLIAWEFVQEYWPRLRQMFQRDNIFLNAILTKTTSYFHTEFKYNQVKSFLEGVLQDSDVVKQCLEAIRVNIKWQHQIEKKFVEWLNQR